ncbi:MAG: hypothetical protein K5928_00535 [Prevotella sp.]|nr:hypothetical protein [Prevotella sp.]
MDTRSSSLAALLSEGSPFAAGLRPLLGAERWQRLCLGLTAEPPVSVRLNPGRRVSLAAEGTPVAWCRHGYWLTQRPAFTFDPLLHAGCYYVQEAASMVIDSVVSRLGLTAPVTCLDMCAAPGGKSTALCAALPAGSTVVSNEPLRPRAQVLAENMAKWGYAGSIVTNNYPADFAKAGLLFDIILVDAPCSGEGMFRKDPEAVSIWSQKKVAQCVALQRAILSTAWQCLRPGGTLIYSTCTLNHHEDEEQLLWLLQSAGAVVTPSLSELCQTAAGWGCLGSLLPGHAELPVLRFMPGFTRSEGLFVCAVQKSGWREATDPARLRAVAERQLQVLPLYALAEPGQQQAELDYPTAIAYLRGEAVVLPSHTQRGMVSVAYGGQPLGQAKNLGPRANNLYPKSWRIKSSHAPAEPPKAVRVER